MAERLPSEPQLAHTTPSPPQSPTPYSYDEDSRRHSHKSAQDLLHEDDDRIATELPELPAAHIEDVRRRSNGSRDTAHDEGSYHLAPELIRATTREEQEEEAAHRAAGLTLNRYRLVRVRKKWWHPFSVWWNRHVSVKVDVKYRRDHLALERTFLGYLRTSLALSMTGVLIAQLFRLQKSPTPSTSFGYYVSGEPLAACFISAAIGVLLIGAIRFWRQQSAMVRGKVWAGGWEVYTTMAVAIALVSGLFAVVVGVIAKHDVDEAAGKRP